MKLLLDLLTLAVNDPQIPQLRRGIPVQVLENKSCLLKGIELSYPFVFKGFQYRGFFQTDGDDLLLRHKDAERDRHIAVLQIGRAHV